MILLVNSSFESCKQWYKELKESGEAFVEIILIGNKTDLENEREVSTEEAQAFANEKGFPYIETSVLANKNIKEAFQLLLNKVINHLKKLDVKSMSNSTQMYSSPGMRRRVDKSSILLRKESEFLDSRRHDKSSKG